jgi:hypothetical protein
VTGWEGESLSLPDSGRLLLDKLVAAGVGQRPVVFVCHSMGGLIVKVREGEREAFLLIRATVHQCAGHQGAFCRGAAQGIFACSRCNCKAALCMSVSLRGCQACWAPTDFPCPACCWLLMLESEHRRC